MSGSPCFYGTRVPLQNLFDALEGGGTVEEFAKTYSVDVEVVKAVLRLGLKRISESLAA